MKMNEILSIEDVNNCSLFVVEDENYVSIHCTLWGEYVDSFLNQRDFNLKMVPIVLVQFFKPTLFNGVIRCGTVYNASKVLLNKDVDVINRFRERIKNDDSFMKELPVALKSGKREVVDEIEGNLKSIETLFYLELLNGQDGNYWICARVESVNCYGDWYMLKFEVFDGTSTAQLVLWDKECVHILQKKAAEVNFREVLSPNTVPKEIEELVTGKIFLFKIFLRKEDDFLSLKP
ncbi:hypothetical protein AAHA92_06446 [Salvia divinorum]|uniref:Uncharacterized protein n=1 Tax=Salvia divinorum TaxID=28513 RepID=A0ABD1I9N9_SALDI